VRHHKYISCVYTYILYIYIYVYIYIYQLINKYIYYTSASSNAGSNSKLVTMTRRSFSSPPPQLQYQQGGASKAWANQKLPSFESLLLAPCWSLRLWSAVSEHSSLIHLECSKQSLAICEMNSRSGQTKTFASHRCSNKLLQICRNISRSNLLSTVSHAMLCMYIRLHVYILYWICVKIMRIITYRIHSHDSCDPFISKAAEQARACTCIAKDVIMSWIPTLFLKTQTIYQSFCWFSPNSHSQAAGLWPRLLGPCVKLPDSPHAVKL